MSAALHLIAGIAGRTVAFDSAAVQSVVDIDIVVPTPRAEPGVVGIAALRSRVVTVIDPAVMLGAARSTADVGRAVVTTIDGHCYAILVDWLNDIAEHDIAPTPAGIALEAGWGRASLGMIDRGGEPVVVLDPVKLIPHASFA